MLRRILMPTAAVILIAAAPPQAKPATTIAAKPTPAPTPMNCLLASNVFTQRATDQQHKELAHETLVFYLGRLDPRTAPSQLASALKQTADSLKGVNAASLMNECVGELRAKANMFDTVGRQLQQQRR